MHCNRCLKLAVKKEEKIGFRAECPHCGSDLHTCSHCKYYSLGKPNNCLVPGTEFIKNREENNFCEDFRPKEPSSPNSNKKRGEDHFNSLFKDH